MKTQYNFKIEEDLKQELEATQQQSNAQNKEEFLIALLNSYKLYQANQIDTDIDLSKYETVSNQTKTVIHEAFKHILATLESNNTNTKQQALSLEKDKLSLIDERKAFQEQIEHLQADHNQKLLDMDNQHKEELQHKDEEIEKLKKDIQDISDNKDTLTTQLSEVKQELSQVQAIAEQVQSITDANKELREQLSKAEKEHKKELLEKEKELQHQFQKLQELEKENIKNEVSIENKSQEVEKLEEQLKQLEEKDKEIKKLEKQNTILETKLEILEKEAIKKYD